jgi:hypothetical protein
VDKFRVQGSALLAMVTSLFEGTRWENAIKKEGQSVNVKEAHLSLLGCCTSDTYANMWLREAISIGLPNRLFVVNAEQKVKVAWPLPPDPERLKEIKARIQGQVDRLPQYLTIAADAKAAWEHWYTTLPPSEHAKRLDTIGMRLLALTAFTSDKEEVDLDTVNAVVAILNYELQIRMVTDPIDADDRIAKLESRIRRQLEVNRLGLTERDLRRRIHADRDGLWAFRAALENLKRAGDIELRGTLYVMTDLSPLLSPAAEKG